MQNECINYVIFVHYADDTTPSDTNVEISTKKGGVLLQDKPFLRGIDIKIFGQFLSDPTIDSLLTILVSGPKYPLI